jgi:putative ABC transport system permease protein
MWTDEEAQRLVGEQDRFSSIAVAAEEGVSQRQVADEIGRTLDTDGVTGVEVVTGEEITEETQSDIKESLSFLTIFFLVFAIIALFVGTFVIYNSFSIIVAQRTREMALLRAIGARRRQIRRSVIVEALLVGLTGSLLGFVIGLGLATLLGSFLQLPSGGLAILPMSVAVAIVTGVVVTVVSAVLPAWRASRVAPLAAMREVAVDRTGRSRVRFAVGLVVLAVGLAVVISGALGSEPATVGVGAALVFISLVVVSPGLARPVSRLLGTPVARLRGVAGRLAKDNAGRNPKRTSATAQALMIGVGLVAFIFVINASIRASIDQTLDESFAGDFVIDTGTFGLIGLPTSVAADIEQLPDVALVSPLRFSPAKVDGGDTSVVGTNAGAFELLDLGMVEGTDELDPGQLVISQSKADSEDLAVGDELDVSFLDDRRPDRDRAATVAGIYDDTTAAGGIGSWVVGLDDYDAAISNATDAQVFVQLRDGVSVAEAEPEIERVVEPYATAEVQSVDEFKDALGGQLDFFLNLIVVLLALSVFIAVLGIGNTIALSVLERTRELGLLRAVGMRRRQVRATVRWEAMIISLFGTALGLAFGLVGGWGIVRSLRDEGFGVFEVPIGPFVGLAIVGALVGAGASVWPAWRASRLNVLDAIASE